MTLLARGSLLVSPDSVRNLAGCAVMVAASVAGNIALIMDNGSILILPVVVGANKFENLAIEGYTATGTTATITSVYILYP